MRSLRGRLVAILLVVSFAGLVVLAAVTYAAQRSYLYDRVDRQVESGFVLVLNQLVSAEQTGSNSCVGGIPGAGSTETRGGAGRPGPGAGRRPPGISLPPGTYGAVLDSNGGVISECVFGFSDPSEATQPRFEDAALGGRPESVQSRDGDGTEFRAARRALPTGETAVVAIPLEETSQTLNRLLTVEAIVIALVLSVLGVLAWLLVGIGLRPLDRMGRTADAIAGGDLSRRVDDVDERSEIGRLALALNRMLERLEQAFAERQASENRLRQFLADASHELRTPLVSIRGYAELRRLGATPEPAEVDRSMRRIEQEAERMGALVEDMLTLARLDETREHDHARIDLKAVGEDAVRDAEVAAPDRLLTLEADDDMVVDGDRDRLQQVFANLLRNASVHTPAASPIDVSIVREGSNAKIVVRDYGAGLPSGVGDQIFERFWRAESGRERGKAGSGLGLAIVAEIVAAHGGRVRAQNCTDGPGAEFSVWLPLAPLSQLSD